MFIRYSKVSDSAYGRHDIKSKVSDINSSATSVWMCDTTNGDRPPNFL